MNKQLTPEWNYDEVRHLGVDYANPKVAEEYDAKHEEFRDYEKDASMIVDRLGLNNNHVILDLGCGTGGFALSAAKICQKVHAVDISVAMLNQLNRKAAKAGLENIETHCAGFLTYEHNDKPVDAIVSVAVLHHLPDFWKTVALKRMHDMLRPKGKLYLFDVVFSFPIDCYKTELNNWINAMAEKADKDIAKETIVHIREEYSTFDWIIEGLLTRSGFDIDHKYCDFPNCITYVSQKS